MLIAGKGRHTYQIFADRVVPFDDAQVAREWLRRHSTPGRTGAAFGVMTEIPRSSSHQAPLAAAANKMGRSPASE